MTPTTARETAARAACDRYLSHWVGAEAVTPAEVERVRAILHDEAPDHDATGVPFGPGSRLWSSNLRPCTVLYPADVQADAVRGRASGRLVIWWETTDGLADGSRLVTRHPATRAHA